MVQIIGSVVVAASVFGGFLWSGGHLLALWHPSEIVVICGAALGAFMISNPPKVSKQAFAQALALPKGARYQRDEYVDLLKLVYDILVKMRKEGLLAIEADIEKPEESALFKKYPNVLEDHHMVTFITGCLLLVLQPLAFHDASQLVIPFRTYCESVKNWTSQPSFNALSASTAACSSMRLLVVAGEPPEISLQCLS